MPAIVITKNSIIQGASADIAEVVPENLSDKDLYKLCQKYGSEARKWTRHFAGLLPEVMKRRIHRKYGFESIYEFAAKLCGMNMATVDEVLRISARLGDKPILKSKLKTEGWSKLRVVAGIATKENEGLLAEQVEKLSKSALEEYVREIRLQFPENASREREALFNKPEMEVGEDSGESRDSGKSVHRLDFNIDKETEFEFRKIKYELEKEKKEALTMGEALKILIEQAKELKKLKKQLKVQKQSIKVRVESDRKRKKVKSQKVGGSRYVQVDIRREIQQKYQGKCVVPGCNEPATELHHAERFALSQSHEKLYPLCKTHHELAHCGLIGNERGSPEKWHLRVRPDKKGLAYLVDQRVQEFKRKSRVR